MINESQIYFLVGTAADVGILILFMAIYKANNTVRPSILPQKEKNIIDIEGSIKELQKLKILGKGEVSYLLSEYKKYTTIDKIRK